ncbi:MAG: nucleotidyltransferase domain-containing protein [Candidatus Alkanophagales archaeon]
MRRRERGAAWCGAVRARLRIRDFVTTREGWIFSVVRYELPGDAVIKSLLRYVPDERGDRVSKDGRRFRKLSFEEARDFLRERKPEYLEGVPRSSISEVLLPSVRIKEVAAADASIGEVYDFLRGAGVQPSKIGITGSYLCGLQKDDSDADFVIYGRRNFERVRAAICESDELKLDDATWRRIYEKRRAELSYEEFLAHELRKCNRGLLRRPQRPQRPQHPRRPQRHGGCGYGGGRGGEGEEVRTYFDVLFVRDWGELRRLRREDVERGEPLRHEKIIARVRNAEFAFDNPAIYEVEHETVDKILCFTHTYAGQAFEDEVVEARGVLEKYGDELRLVVGTSREPRGEWIRSLSLLNELKASRRRA